MKPKLLLRAPVLTASGYGVHARQVLKALLASGNYDVSVESISWGHTPFLTESNHVVDSIRHLVAKREFEAQQNVQYDISVQVTIPNEFQKLAPVNIGVTAGIEVDRVSPEWIQKCNENIDLVIVPSSHSARTLADIQYRTKDGQFLRLTKPVAVCPEGFDATVFNTLPASEELTNKFKFDAPFNFLCVGLGLDKPLGEDRKNIGLLVKWFCERFAGDSSVGLVLKVGLVGNSLLDFETLKRRVTDVKASTGCGEYPKIQLVHGRLSDLELAALYKHPQVKALVSLTHGEGYGLPLLEAAACGLPVIATNWSGHLDFLSIEGKKRFVPIEFDMGAIPASAIWKGVMEEGTQWAYPKEDDVKLKLKKLILSYEKPQEWAKELAVHVKENLTVERVSYTLATTLAKFLNDYSAQPRTINEAADFIKKKLDLPKGKTLLFTMPMSGGDVFISTAVVDSLKKKFPEHFIYFATEPKYFDILFGNPFIDRVIPWENWMTNVPLCELIFSDVFTPNLAIQTTTANWVRGGKGRLLGNEIAAQCGVEFGEYQIVSKKVEGLPEKYVVLHPGSGKGQWEARRYNDWQNLVTNLVNNGIQVVQIGLEDDPHYEGCVDLRGKTNYNQMAYVIEQASGLVGIDSLSMHMAAAFGTPHVAIFGSSYSTSTGPVNPKGPSVLIDAPNRMGCEKACYKYQCAVDAENPCVNEIESFKILDALQFTISRSTMPELLGKPFEYKEVIPKIFGYTHILNPDSQGFPYLESIRSMLGFCEEVVVVDGGSTDGSLTRIEVEINDPRVKVINREWDWTEPGMDGMQKAFGRAMCNAGPNDFLWQQDADEVVHEEDYEKIKKLAKKFPKDVNLIHLPVVELWGFPDRVRTDRHSWKWRMSRNDFRITHGINKNARVIDEKTGRTFARKGMSDGCEYIDIVTGDFVNHKGFYTQELEFLRQRDPKAYGEAMNNLFEQLPCVFHYSWMDLDRKVRNFRDFWDKCWSNLYNDTAPQPRFPDVKTNADVRRKAGELLVQGGEHGPAATFDLRRSNPTLMINRFKSKTPEQRLLEEIAKNP